jgi:P27 family predicted phage terminase small subunit
MKGRKPELHAIEGGLAKVPGAPSWLPAESRAEWRRVLPELIKRRTVTRSDLASVEAYCLAIGTMQRAQATIAAEGEIVTNASGDTRRHPAFQTLFQSLAESRRLAAELGLTPASRNKAAALEDANDDELAGMVG